MSILTEWEKIKINRIRMKNRKVWSNYLYMCDRNKTKEKALITFTSPKKTESVKLLDIKHIKKHFSKLLSNLKIDIDKFVVVELGEKKNNPHVHIQLFYNEQDEEKIRKVYIKTLHKFNLLEKRCSFSTMDKTKTHIKYFSYILKEYSKRLSDDEILALDKARTKLKINTSKYMKFISYSHNLLTKAVYKYLYHVKGIEYSEADYLYNEKYLKVIKYKNSFKLEWTIRPVLELILYLFLPIKNTKIRQKRQYINKRVMIENHHKVYSDFDYNHRFT